MDDASLLFINRVVIKGRHDDEAVLCTRDSTHDLRVCETSNSLLLCPALSYPSNNKTSKSIRVCV